MHREIEQQALIGPQSWHQQVPLYQYPAPGHQQFQSYYLGQPQDSKIHHPYQTQAQNSHEDPVGDGEIPLEDPDFESPGAGGRNGVVMPSAPPMEEMVDIPGYAGILSPTVAFVAPPPSYQEATSGRALDNFLIGRRMTEDEARERLVEYVKKRCCWGKAAAEGMWFRDLQQSTGVHYVLKTFLETRSTRWAAEPFRGQMIDGPESGDPPTPWEIEVETPDNFHDTVFLYEVPHTACVRSCHGCHGTGRVKCSGCSGWGRNRCFSCQGTGQTGVQETHSRCVACDGSGHRRCTRCQGRGRIACAVCDGAGQLRCFVELTVTFKTHVSDYIFETTCLPSDLIRHVPGTILLEDTQPLLNPIQTFPEQKVNAESARIVQEHKELARKGRIWMQNHVIRGVPVFQCDCAWKDKEFQFFVYGDNRQVYVKKYPQTCCCCRCQLL